MFRIIPRKGIRKRRKRDENEEQKQWKVQDAVKEIGMFKRSKCWQGFNRVECLELRAEKE